MKNMLSLIALFLAIAIPAVAQQHAEIDLVESVHVVPMTIAGVSVTANHTVYTLVITEPDGTSSTKTLGTGTANDQCTVETLSLYCHFTFDQLGGHKVLWYNAANAVILGFADVYVHETVFMDCWLRGSCATAAAVGSASADALLDEPLSGHTAVGTLGQQLQKVSGTADSGTTLTIVDAERTIATTDSYRNSIIHFTSGTNIGESRLITAFTPASDTITFAPALPAAASTETYLIEPRANPPVIQRGTEYAGFRIFMRSATNPTVGVTGQTVTCQRDTTGSFVNATNNGTVAEIGRGFYTITWTLIETNVPTFDIICTGTGGSGSSQLFTQTIFTQQ